MRGRYEAWLARGMNPLRWVEYAFSSTVMIVAIAWIFLRERLAPLQMVGIAVSLGGVLAILSQGSLAVLAAFRRTALASSATSSPSTAGST